VKALEIEPRDCIANFELANIFRKRKEYFQAEMLYRSAVDLDDTNPHALYNLASFLVEIDHSEEAQRYFDLAYEYDTEGKLKRGNN
jgi:Tfp pilus assembly protein PilF